jgi:hypothetical protein
MTREEWLNKAKEILIDSVFSGIDVPENIKVSCGFAGVGKPKKMAGFKVHVLGVCCPSEFSTGGFTEIFIDPVLDESSRVLDVLVHEMIHAILGSGKGHGKEFKKIALSVGLEGKMTSTVAGENLKVKLDNIVEEIGEYPHKAYQLINPDSKKEDEEEKEKPDKIVNLRCLQDKILVKTHESNLTDRSLIFKCPVCEDELKRKAK